MSIEALNRKTIAWAFYDWANSAFALSVLAVLFPLVLRNHWSAGDAAADVTARLAWITFAASVIVCVTAPLFGTIADAGGYRKRFLLILAILGATMTAALGFVEAGNWQLALGVYLFASIGYYSSTVFYDSLLMDVARPAEYDRVSAFGFGMGYLGGGLLFLLNVLMTTSPGWFGLRDAGEAVRLAFLSVALWWAVSSLPMIFWVSEQETVDRQPAMQAVRAGLRQLAGTVRQIRALRPVLIFLLAYWLYIDGVHTIIKLAVDYGIKLGFESADLVKALLLTQFVAFPAALAFGWLGERIGARRGIFLALAIYMAVTVWASRISQAWVLSRR